VYFIKNSIIEYANNKYAYLLVLRLKIKADLVFQPERMLYT